MTWLQFRNSEKLASFSSFAKSRIANCHWISIYWQRIQTATRVTRFDTEHPYGDWFNARGLFFFFNKIGLTFRPPLFPRFGFFKKEIVSFRTRVDSLTETKFKRKLDVRNIKVKSESWKLKIPMFQISKMPSSRSVEFLEFEIFKFRNCEPSTF